MLLVRLQHDFDQLLAALDGQSNRVDMIDQRQCLDGALVRNHHRIVDEQD